jgi:hypothetical protein
MNIKQKTLVKVPFGKEGYVFCKNNARTVNGELDWKKLSSEIFDYIIDGLMSELKNQGYRSIGRQRILYEEACDYQAKLNINYIFRVRKESNYTQVPKFVYFTLDYDIPKEE